MKILDNIDSPADLRRLSEKELVTLAGEIRQTITETAAKNGGHLASNLGTVDAEIAIHRVFSLPEDTVIFDVGHQAYTHKILTGRRKDFASIRLSGGISGFTNRVESEYDTVTAGHSGTALSTAIGIAEANRLAGRDSWTVALIGDGSFTNGMVYEALDQLAGKKLKLILVLNDNAMSISKNVGGLSGYFSRVRTSERYFSFKLHTKRIFMAIPGIGSALVDCASALRDFFKRLVGAQTWFESLGLDYIGPVDGNDIHKLTAVLEEAKHKDSPVVVHMTTVKGLGYRPAEEHPERYHSTAPFDIRSGETVGQRTVRSFTDAVSSSLVARAKEDSGIVAVTAAMTDGCGLALFSREYPDRFFDVGIAEEHAVTFASGLSLGGRREGLKPVVVMYSTFSQRVFDQLWHDFCLQNKGKNDLSLTLLLSHAGFVPGDGVTHQGIYDVALLSRLPEVTIWSPDTFDALESALDEALSSRTLTVVRYPKGGECVYGVPLNDRYTWKEASFGEGDARDVVVTYGRISENVMKAAEICAARRHGTVRVVILTRIKPLPDDKAFVSLLASAERVTFVEEGIRSGGVGEALAASRLSYNVRVIAVDDPYIPAGDISETEKYAGFDTATLADRLEK